MADLPAAAAPVDVPQTPGIVLPDGACDAHAHLIGEEYKLMDGRVENPPPGKLAHWLDVYRQHLRTLGFQRGVIVHSILYGTDMSVTQDAVRAMGPGFVGVGLVTDDATRADIAALAKARIRAVRLNYVHGGVLTWEGARRLAPILADHDMHIEMLAHSHLHLEELAPQIPDMPVRIVFDHCAWPDPSLGADTAGQKAFDRLLGDGHVWTKLSARYRFGTDDQARAIFSRLAQLNPERCMWGSDWPHLMLGGVDRPDAGHELRLFLDAVPDAATQRQILVKTPEQLYRFGP